MTNSIKEEKEEKNTIEVKQERIESVQEQLAPIPMSNTVNE